MRTHLWAHVEDVELPNLQLLDRDGIVARVASISFIAGLPGNRRAEVLDQVHTLVESRSEPIELPYTCEIFVWQRVT